MSSSRSRFSRAVGGSTGDALAGDGASVAGAGGAPVEPGTAPAAAAGAAPAAGGGAAAAPAGGAAPRPARAAGSSRRSSARTAAAPSAPSARAGAPGPAPAGEPGAGAAGYLVLPGPADPLWTAVPLGLRQNLAMPAYQLVNPARGHLATPAGRKLKAALGAAARGKITGTHWLVLLTAARTAFGGPASARAEQAYSGLQEVVADYLRPALSAVAVAEFAAGVELAATAPAPAPAAGAPAPEPAGDLAERLRETAEHPGTILAVTSTRTTTAQTALARCLTDLDLGLPVVQVSGHDRSSLVRALYTQLGLGRRRRLPSGLAEAEDLITTELRRATRLIIATGSLGLRPTALQLLHRLWGPKPFPLVLVGDTTLDGLLQRHDL
ncbi:hypothetical protein FHR34_007410, partial [Kitasatospora kifunensis]|nr:hypothetical protein [Kitasatospora kifunensis]